MNDTSPVVVILVLNVENDMTVKDVKLFLPICHCFVSTFLYAVKLSWYYFGMAFSCLTVWSAFYDNFNGNDITGCY